MKICEMNIAVDTMKIERTEEKGVVVVALAGQFDAVAAPGTEATLLEMAAEANGPVVVDLSELEYIGSLGLQALLRFSQALRQKGLSLVLCGLRPFVRQVFEISQFARLFELRSCRSDALSDCAQVTER